MSGFKNKNRDSVRELQENSRETLDLGNGMQEQADQINGMLDEIELQDDEDIAAVGDTKGSYQKSFDTAFSDQVESAGDAIGQQGELIQNEVAQEQEHVRRGIGSMEQAGGVSEIGRDAADAGAEKLEDSERTYDEIASDAAQVADDTASQIEQLKNRVSRIFG